jgi:hypothetical protein
VIASFKNKFATLVHAFCWYTDSKIRRRRQTFILLKELYYEKVNSMRFLLIDGETFAGFEARLAETR